MDWLDSGGIENSFKLLALTKPTQSIYDALLNNQSLSFTIEKTQRESHKPTPLHLQKGLPKTKLITFDRNYKVPFAVLFNLR